MGAGVAACPDKLPGATIPVKARQVVANFIWASAISVTVRTVYVPAGSAANEMECRSLDASRRRSLRRPLQSVAGVIQHHVQYVVALLSKENSIVSVR
jgi:hypothetical protein